MYRFRTTLILSIIVLLGCILRFLNLNWDSGYRIHPDEALIVNGTLSITFFSQLFPGFHDYNGLSIYILKIASLIFQFLTHTSWWSTSPEGVTIVGRFISAIISSLSILLVYFAGLRLWNNKTGIIASLLFATTPLHIQLAHFYTTESLLVFLFLLLIHGIISFAKTANTQTIIQMSIPTGLLLATKNTSYFFLILPIAIILRTKSTPWHTFRTFCIWGCVSSIVFFLASPYSFIDWQGYLIRSVYLRDVVSGRLLMDWTLQFQQTNGLFWLPTLLMSFGPTALIGCIGSIGIALQNSKKNRVEWILAWWSIGFFLFLAYTYLKFTRYLAPLMPIYALFGAKILHDILATRVGRMLYILCITVQVLMGCMYASIYITKHTSLQATDWISQNIPNGSVIMTEEWNDIIRFNQLTRSGKHFIQQSFNFYSLPDDRTKLDRLNILLSNTDYIIVESPKVKNTIMRQSSRYPISSQWYTDLDTGRLKFQHIKTFSSYPRIGPFFIADDYLEETYTVFDHPTLSIYKKEK